MKRIAVVAAATLAAGPGWAGALDRSNQDVTVLFEEGTHARLSFGYVAPDVSGVDRELGFGTNGSGDVADNYFTASLGYKQPLGDALSFALILDQPYGVDIEYPGAADGSANLGGTEAVVNSAAITALLRYQFGGGFSVHGGLRSEKIDARVALGGVAYADLNGYEADFDGDAAVGWQAGVAYERPDIALRVSLTYSSEIEHEFDTVETVDSALIQGALLGGQASLASTTDLTTPEALNLDVQTGVAEGTLVFGSVRYARYSDVALVPTVFDAAVDLTNPDDNSLIDLDDSLDVRLGVARRLTDRLAGLASVTWSRRGEDDLVSPLAPTNGSVGLTLAGRYQILDAVSLTAGLNYTRIGDAEPRTGTPEVARADFDDNDAIGVGVQIGYSF